MSTFELDSRLAADTLSLADLPLCRALLMNDARFPWVILVPRRPGVREIFELSNDDQMQLHRETTALGQALQLAFQGDKLNVAALGNVVSQLHVHLVVRFTRDDAWPAPVWGKGEAVPYSPTLQRERRERILAHMDKLDV
ncbi:HIT domain-containing protein [Halomonas sp. PAMB 3232]|uniref:HIT domain-containing protein n=1 Tax=Halomonas sp. PAMB 3232 TaxID=3075221 RepID=UPI0028A160AB|nr:HIT domain-containing protein [Halomonas sp. PAMB 3232]WNL38465.1 HIT domain-containing protein [Halomonas sp. PAMB 3232]